MSFRKILFFILIGSWFALAAKPAFAQVQPPVFEPLPDSLARLIDSLVSVADSYRVLPPIIANTDSTSDSSGRFVIEFSPADSAKLKKRTALPVSYKIRGTVRDKGTGEGIPFATVFFPGTSDGTAADVDGHFELRVQKLPSDTIHVQAIGYEDGKRRLNADLAQQNFIIELERADNTLEEFVFKYEDPVVVLLNNIIARKPVNNPDRTSNYKYESYNKLEIDLERLTREQFEKLPIPYMKQFSFIYDNLDTTSEETPFLPLYLTETLADYYFQREPKKTREFIKASQIKGFKNESVTGFMGTMYQNINVYDNFIPVLGKEFASPIGNQGLFYYNYKIKDTQQAYGHNIILVQFQPRRAGENTFYGDFWVVDSLFAIQRMSLEVPKDANINWVTRVSLYQEFAPINDTLWFPVKDKFVANFSMPYKINLPGFIGRKTTSYKDIVVNDPSVTHVLNDPKIKQDVIIADTARETSDEFWATARHDSLSNNEKAIYQMIDTLQSMPLFTRYKSMIKFLATGKVELGKIEVGPVWNVYSSNPFEGNRFRLSLGTTPKLFKDIKLQGYVAYGTKDEDLKYNGEVFWILKRHPRMYLNATHTRDLDRSTSYYDEVKNDNLFANYFRKGGIPWKLLFTEDTRLEFYKEYFSGFSHMLSLIHKDINPFEPLPDKTIFTDDAGKSTDHVVNTEVNLRLRFAYKEKYVEGPYKRISIKSKYPILEMRYGMGLKGVLRSGYEYHKVTMSVSDNLDIPPLGEIYYNVFAGKYFGTLPYTLLEVHPGNEFYYYNKHAFNMMNRFEFISDEYAGINFEHSIGEGIFNYIPLLKKAKLRQFWGGKVLYGNMSEANRLLNLDKGYTFRTLNTVPYIEVSTGIGNILQVFMINFVWRLSPELLPGESNDKYFGIFGSVRFDF